MENGRGIQRRSPRKESRAFSANQPRGHVKDQLPVGLRETAEKLADALEEFRGFAGAAPLIAIGRHAFGEARALGRPLAVVKQTVRRDLKGAGYFFQGF